MRDAAGELADRLHLLGLAQRLLGVALVGPVHDDAGHADGRAVGAVLDPALGRDPADGAVGAPDPAFEVERPGLAPPARRRASTPARSSGDDVGEEGLAGPRRGSGVVVAEDRVVRGASGARCR